MAAKPGASRQDRDVVANLALFSFCAFGGRLLLSFQCVFLYVWCFIFFLFLANSITFSF